MNITKEKAKEILFSLLDIPTVSGSEHLAEEKLTSIFGEYFDVYRSDTCGGHIFEIKCGKKNAKRLLIDTHIDEIGFIVTKVLEDGFLKVANVGGIDTRILPAAKVKVYGKETVPAYFASTPPHLQQKGASSGAPELSELMLDTSLGDKAEEIVPVGTLCSFASEPAVMLFDCVTAHGLDNKSSCAAALLACMCVNREKLCFDIVLHLAGREEVGCVGGRTGAYDTLPDLALVIDTEFAAFPGVRSDKTVKRGGGPSLTVTPVCDSFLTTAFKNIAAEISVPTQKIVYSSRTGTDADVVNITANGIPCVLMGIPLSNMHTAEEIIDLNDIVNAAKLICAFAEREGVCER